MTTVRHTLKPVIKNGLPVSERNAAARACLALGVDHASLNKAMNAARELSKTHGIHSVMVITSTVEIVSVYKNGDLQ